MSAPRQRPQRPIGTIENGTVELREITDCTVTGTLMERGDIGDTVKVSLSRPGVRIFIAEER